MKKRDEMESSKQNSNLLAAAYPIDEMKGRISKKLVVPPGKTGVAVFRDGRIDLFTPGDNRVISNPDRLMGKGGGFWAGYFPAANFNASVSITNLLSGDEKILDLNILCDVSVENEEKFFLDVVVPRREIPNQSLVVDLPEVFTSFASLVRNYSSEDLVSGQLDEAINAKAQSLLTLMLPAKGLKLEGITLISIWNHEDGLAIKEQLFVLDQKMKDLEFDKKLAEVEGKEELDQLLNESGIQLPKKAAIIPLQPGKKKNVFRNWIGGVKDEVQPGHNFRLRSLLAKKDENAAVGKPKPLPKNWWVSRMVYLILVVLAAAAATYFLRQLSDHVAWLGQPWIYVGIWMGVIGILIRTACKLFRKWESSFEEMEKPANVLGLENLNSRDKAVIDQIVREQLNMELALQRDVLNELRARVYRQGDEDLALEIKQVERKLESILPKVSDTKIGRPVYLRDEVNLTRQGWNLLMDEEEILLVKAALLTDEAQALQALAGNAGQISTGLIEYETKLDDLANAFVGRERLLHSTID